MIALHAIVPGRHTSWQSSTPQATVSSSYVKRKQLLLWVFLNSSESEGSPAPPQLHPPGQAWPMGRFILYGKKVGQASHRCLLGCLLWPCQDLNTLVQQKWQETPERQTGTARHCAGSQWCSQGQDNASRLVWHSGCKVICHFQLQALTAANSLLVLWTTLPSPSTPKIAKVTFAELQAPKKLCFFQTSQGEQTRESQSVLPQLMQLIRIVLNSESKWISNEISPQV